MLPSPLASQFGPLVPAGPTVIGSGRQTSPCRIGGRTYLVP